MATEGILLFLEFSLYNNSFLSSERELRIKHRKKMERLIIVLILMNAKELLLKIRSSNIINNLYKKNNKNYIEVLQSS